MFLYVFVCVLSHVPLCDPMDCRPPAPLFIGFPRQEHWSGLPFPSPGDLPDPGIEPASSALSGGFFPTMPPGKPQVFYSVFLLSFTCKYPS